MKYIWMFSIAIVTAMFVSCSDDDGSSYPDGDGPVTVNKVFLLDADASVPEREVTFARLGQTLRLQGEGFGGTRKIYVNGYETYFNSALATDNSLILQLQSKTPISTAEADVRNTIQFVKDNATYTYSFIVRAASPQITSISNTLPMAGEIIVVRGANLEETTQVTLPGGIVVTDITNADEDESGEWFSFVMPDGVTESGSITTEGANGTAVSAAYFNNRDCVILDFDGTGAQGYWSWSETGSMINADDLVDDPLNSGRGKVCQLIPERLLEAGVAAGKNRGTEIWTAGNGNDMDDWSRMYPYIGESTPLIDVAFQFDIYVPEAWANTGYIQINLANNASFTGYDLSGWDYTNNAITWFIPWINGTTVEPYQTTGWQTITVPLSELGRFALMIEDGKNPTFQELVEYRNGTDYRNFGMALVNGDFTYNGVEYVSSICKQRIYIDNMRIVPCKTTIVSDFPDE